MPQHITRPTRKQRNPRQGERMIGTFITKIRRMPNSFSGIPRYRLETIDARTFITGAIEGLPDKVRDIPTVPAYVLMQVDGARILDIRQA